MGNSALWIILDKWLEILLILFCTIKVLPCLSPQRQREGFRVTKESHNQLTEDLHCYNNRQYIVTDCSKVFVLWMCHIALSWGWWAVGVRTAWSLSLSHSLAKRDMLSLKSSDQLTLNLQSVYCVVCTGYWADLIGAIAVFVYVHDFFRMFWWMVGKQFVHSDL